MTANGESGVRVRARTCKLCACVRTLARKMPVCVRATRTEQGTGNAVASDRGTRPARRPALPPCTPTRRRATDQSRWRVAY